MSRRFALLRELLIDLDEWCEEHGIGHALPFPTALTPALCDAIERIPFRRGPGDDGKPAITLGSSEDLRCAACEG